MQVLQRDNVRVRWHLPPLLAGSGSGYQGDRNGSTPAADLPPERLTNLFWPASLPHLEHHASSSCHLPAPAAVLHHRPPHRRHHLPDPADHADRLDSGRNLGSLCPQPVQHRPQDRKGDSCFIAKNKSSLYSSPPIRMLKALRLLVTSIIESFNVYLLW